MPFDLPEAEIIAAPVQPEAAMAFWQWRAALSSGAIKELDAGARERAFYVAGLTEQDAVQRVKEAMQEALDNGETLADFKTRILDTINREGWKDSRVETIFRNNMQSAYAAGRYAKMQEVKRFRPYWQYFIIEDGRARPSHAILNNLVFHADHEFWASNYPPNGHRCRCGVRTLSERQMEREGLSAQENMPGDGIYTDPATGMEYHVARPGADDGWGSNPGKTWIEDIRSLAIEKMETAPDLAPTMARRFTQGDFENWSREPRGNFPLVALPKADAELIGGKSVVGRLSAETYAKQLKHHPELTAKDYLTAQDAVEQGVKIQQDSRNLAYALDRSDGVVVIVKATLEGDELYVTSLRRMSRKEAERERLLRKLGNRKEE